MIAVITALATVAGIVITTALVSNAHVGWWANRPSGSACTTSPSPSASAQAAAQDDNTTSTTELVAHTTVEDGVTHVHYGPPEQRDRDRGRDRDRNRNRPRCTPSPSTSPSASPTDETPDPTTDPGTGETPDPTESAEPSPSPSAPPPLDIVTTDCSAGGNELLPPHTGFQADQAQCVQTSMGAVPAVQNSPSVLITEFPETVAANEPFTVTISFRNIVRDEFLAAAAGGYYASASFLTPEGIVHGHAHVGIVNLGDGSEAPSPDALINPVFFQAIEDNGGGEGVDFVEFEVANGIATPGLYRFMVWLGDASHRPPLLPFARQQTPVDAVRVTVE